MANELTWYQGSTAPTLQLWWTDADGNLLDLTGATFELRVGHVDQPALLVKTSGVVGAAGSGVEGAGVPNVTVAWAPGDLALPDAAYVLQLTAIVAGLRRICQTPVRIYGVVQPAA